MSGFAIQMHGCTRHYTDEEAAGFLFEIILGQFHAHPTWTVEQVARALAAVLVVEVNGYTEQQGGDAYDIIA